MSVEIETRVVIDGKPYYTRDEAVKEVVRRRLVQAIGAKFPQEPENSVSRVAVILGGLFADWEKFYEQTNELISEIDQAFKSAEDGRAHIRYQQQVAIKGRNSFEDSLHCFTVEDIPKEDRSCG